MSKEVDGVAYGVSLEEAGGYKYSSGAPILRGGYIASNSLRKLKEAIKAQCIHGAFITRNDDMWFVCSKGGGQACSPDIYYEPDYSR